MEVSGHYTCIVDRLHAALPYVNPAAYAFTDFIGEFASASMQLQSDYADGGVRSSQAYLEIDPILKCVYPRRIFVFHNNVLQDPYGGPPSSGSQTLSWVVQYNDNDKAHLQDFTYRSSYYAIEGFTDAFIQPLLASYPPSLAYTRLTTQGSIMQGFSMMVKLISGNFLLNKNPYFSVRWTIGDEYGQNARTYAIAFHLGKGVLFGYSDDGGEQFEEVGEIKCSLPRASAISGNLTGEPHDDPQVWDEVTIETPNSPDDFEQLGAARRATPIGLEVRFLAGQIQIWIGDSSVPFVWPDPRFNADTGAPYWFIDSLTVIASEYDYFSVSAHPSKWAPGASYFSSEQNLGFVPTIDEGYAVHYAPQHPGAAASATDIGFSPSGTGARAYRLDRNGTLLRYRLDIDNGPPTGTYKGDVYTEVTAAVRAVTGFFPSGIFSRPSSPFFVQPIAIEVQHNFDFNTLSISSSCALTMDNYNGEWSNAFNGGFVDRYGHVALQVSMGIAGFDLFTRFTGIWNTGFEESAGTGGLSTVRIMGTDCWLPLNKPVFNLPWFDGWNVYYLMLYLAQIRGVSADRVQFYRDGFVPESPYGDCPNGAGAFFLPIGPAGTPLTRFTGGQSVSSIMQKIAYTLGFLLFFDVNAVLQFYKFVPGNGGRFKQVFTYVPGPEGTLTEIWGAQYCGNTSEIRNKITVVGVNAFGPLWNPLVAHASDDGSIYNDLPFDTRGPDANRNQFANNFLGYDDSLVWVDNLFANLNFATDAANQLLYFLKNPSRYISLQTWMQTDRPIYPLDVIGVDNPKSGAGFGRKAFLVLGVTDKQSYGELPQTTLRGRWLPN